MNTKIINIAAVLAFTAVFPGFLFSQTSREYKLPDPVLTELNRLGEAYAILDQFSEKVWTGWNDYLNFPFMMSFQNGLRVLIGHPEPPESFVNYPSVKVHGLSVYIDTTRLVDFEIKQPLSCGGGVLGYGSYKNQPVTIVDLSLTNVNTNTLTDKTLYPSAESHILVFIHELMHCYQKKILTNEYGNLDLNPDLNYALYSEIEGLALAHAFEQTKVEESLAFLKDFSIARSYKFKGMNEEELNQSRCDEFREGEAQYSEVIILQCLKSGFESSGLLNSDRDYHRFADVNRYIDKYIQRLKDNCSKTLDLYEKNYDYGCFEALLLQRCFPGWQKEIESGAWLDLVLRQKLAINEADSLASLKRFATLYRIDDLKNKHEKVINGRNETYRMISNLKGRTYIISCKPIKQYLSGEVDKSLKTYKLGLMQMYPDGIGTIKFDGISLDMKPLPTEINQLYYIRVVDTDSGKSDKPYSIEYLSKEEGGIYNQVTVSTPLFTLKAPRILIRERSNRVKIVVLSRTSK